MAGNNPRATLGVISFGLALAVVSAGFTFLLGLMAAFFGWGVELAQVMSSLYIGFSPTFVGTIAGAVWAFADGFVFGILVAWLYNRFLLRRGPARREAPAPKPAPPADSEPE